MYLMYGIRVLLSFVILPTIISINHVEQTLSFVICNVFLIGPLIIGIIYAVIITIPIEKVEKEQLAKELERQIKKDEADIIIVAAGRAGVVGAEYVKEGQTIIDVGINVNAEGKLCGDVDYAAVEPIVDAITPVPGGVGSVTTSVLVGHVVVSST